LEDASELSSRWLGGSVMAASDESFGDKENLLKPEPPVFEPGRYGNRGEIVDGWETKRRREPGHDWALIRLGTPGVITSIDVDTSFFTGNFPEACRVEACGREGYPAPAELNGPDSEWTEIVPRSSLRGDKHNLFRVSDPRRFTHVRLSTFPDGGVARLRVLGQVIPDPRPFDGVTLDLASQQHGGAVVASSDAFYTSAQLLNRPDDARTMGEGWETKRRRDEGHDFVVLRLAFVGLIKHLIVDTAHFKYNASAEISVFGSGEEIPPAAESPSWSAVLARIRLQPDTRHLFQIAEAKPIRSIRLDAFPDGGLSRLRVIGSIEATARRRAGYRWFNSLPADQATAVLIDAGLPRSQATDVLEGRPLSDRDLGSTQLGPLAAILNGPGL
jgi:allantoicase